VVECDTDGCEKKPISSRTKTEVEQESVVDGNLATEASLIVLDTMEIVVKVKSSSSSSSHTVLFPLCGLTLL